MFPGVDGFRRTASSRRARQTPILMLTARDYGRHRGRAEAGADDYLTKPFSFEVLLARVRAVAARADPAASAARGRWTSLNQGTREVRRGQRSFHLTRTEHSILELLCVMPGGWWSASR